MSFLEFLLEYYIYILAVLVIIIVGVIGFLVDTKNKDKNKTDVSVSGNVGQNATNVNNDSVNQINAAPTNEVVNNVVSDLEPQRVNNTINNNGVLNDGVNLNVNTNLDNGISNAVGNSLDMTSVISGKSMVYDGGSEQAMSANIANMVVNQQMNPNIGMNTNNVSVNNLNNNMNSSFQNMQSIPNVEMMQQAPVLSNINPANVQDNMVNVNKMQSDISNMVVNPMSVQAVYPQVNVGVAEVPVQAVVEGSSNVSTLNTSNEVGYQQNIQPAMPVNNNSPLTFDVVSPVDVNSNQNMNVQNQMMGIPNNMNVQNNMAFNQGGVTNNVQSAAYQNVMSQSTNVAGQSLNNGNVALNNTIVTSDGAQPFDISSMFANNK